MFRAALLAAFIRIFDPDSCRLSGGLALPALAGDKLFDMAAYLLVDGKGQNGQHSVFYEVEGDDPQESQR